jgi:sugar/nucleoside kinase (ribokinase family)
MKEKICVSGVGCCLVDMLYNGIDFNTPFLKPFFSVRRGDGGLSPGKLVFREEFEAFSGVSLTSFLKSLVDGRVPDVVNIGGPSVVALIHAAQLLNTSGYEVSFYGRTGNDKMGQYLTSTINNTPLFLRNFLATDKPTPSTIVLSDPGYDNGHGERMFINSIGAAWDVMPQYLDDDFFESDITVFGGTALVPNIHDSLSGLLKKAKERGSITIVNTVFDFRNEKKSSESRWPLGDSDESYKYTDLLIADREEAFRLSGCSDEASAITFFKSKDLSAFLMTRGANDVLGYSDGSLFLSQSDLRLPVCDTIVEELKNSTSGDTTGCGDNFAGGVIAEVARTLKDSSGKPNLQKAGALGIVSGGFACFYIGGTYQESYDGEKMERIKNYIKQYIKQMSGE